MAKKITPLTATKIKSAKPEDKDYPLYDGGGLLLLVRPSGAKIWQLRYYRPDTKKRTTISLGDFDNVSLAEARLMRDEAKKLLAQNIDPQLYKQEETERETAERNNTTPIILDKK